MEQAYTQATLELLQGGNDPETVLSGLTKTLEAHGHTKLRPRILKKVYVALSELDTNTQADVTVAKKEDLDRFNLAIEEDISTLGSTGEYRVHLDETIVGGYKVMHNFKLLDKTYKEKLLHIYQSALN